MTEDEMIEWHHRLNGHEFEQILGDGEGQGGLVCCSPWGCKESDTTAQQFLLALPSKQIQSVTTPLLCPYHYPGPTFQILPLNYFFFNFY